MNRRSNSPPQRPWLTPGSILRGRGVDRGVVGLGNLYRIGVSRLGHFIDVGERESLLYVLDELREVVGVARFAREIVRGDYVGGRASVGAAFYMDDHAFPLPEPPQEGQLISV